MNQDLQLKIQAYLDGELPPRDERRVADWIESDPQARALIDELDLTKKMLADNELDRPLPESREFYWSKIQKALDRSESLREPAEHQWLTGLRRMLAPLAGTAMVVFLALAMVQIFRPSTTDTYLSHLAEVETPSDEMGAYSFRSRSGNMFVVWLYDRSSEDISDADAFDDMLQ